MKEVNKKNKQIKLSLNSDKSVEEYANFAITTHSPAEFVIDFFGFRALSFVIDLPMRAPNN